jgi:hypothetical protein
MNSRVYHSTSLLLQTPILTFSTPLLALFANAAAANAVLHLLP